MVSWVLSTCENKYKGSHGSLNCFYVRERKRKLIVEVSSCLISRKFVEHYLNLIVWRHFCLKDSLHMYSYYLMGIFLVSYGLDAVATITFDLDLNSQFVAGCLLFMNPSSASSSRKQIKPSIEVLWRNQPMDPLADIWGKHPGHIFQLKNSLPHVLWRHHICYFKFICLETNSNLSFSKATGWWRLLKKKLKLWNQVWRSCLGLKWPYRVQKY